MKDNKPWYEKISIWITIIASICTISGISVFGGQSLLEFSNNEKTYTNLKNDTDDQQLIAFDNNNTLNYENTNSSNVSKKESSIVEQDIKDESKTQQYSDDYVIRLEDSVFEKLLKKTLNKEQITYKDVKDIQSLYIFEDKIIINNYPQHIYVETLEENMADYISLSDLKNFPLAL